MRLSDLEEAGSDVAAGDVLEAGNADAQEADMRVSRGRLVERSLVVPEIR